MQLKEAGRNLTPNVAYKFTYYSQLAHAKGFYHCCTQLLEIDHFFFFFFFFFQIYDVGERRAIALLYTDIKTDIIPTLKQLRKEQHEVLSSI